MAKRKKPIDGGFGTARNRTKDLKRQVIVETELFDTHGDPHIGVLVLHTPAGHYQFLMAEPTANELIQQLRDFIAGEAERLP